ncbi:hypothetical protein YC2023_106402 [Brassica napus]|uniref:(rape) hypothetical protein n=1 Tax=Brassica napus TaxID=3708 RepID=A0A816NUD7_BRANA|nr:unnamed protein product [Brassica napus]
MILLGKLEKCQEDMAAKLWPLPPHPKVENVSKNVTLHHSFQPETSGYSVHVAMFTRSCLAEDDTLITQLFVKTEIVKLRRQSERWKQ